MVIDGRALDDGQVLETDLCIIGAGAAGIALALRLIGHPVRILMVESGGFAYDDDVQDLCRSEITGLPYNLYDTRMRYFGGSTNHWGGWCRPLDAITFQERPWVPNSGWPIRLEDVQPYYGDAARLCQVDPLELEPELWAERTGIPLFDLPDDGELRNLIFKVSPPTRFGEVYGERLRKAKNVTICHDASIVRLASNAAGQWVERAQARTLTGVDFAIDAKAYVLACGGIENARLLLLSNDVERGGLGNRNDLVGRFFMEHGHFDFARLLLADPSIDAALYLDAHRVDGHGEVNAHLGFSPAAQRRAEITDMTLQLRRHVPSRGEFAVQGLVDAFEQGHLPHDLGRELGYILEDIGPISRWLGGRLSERVLGRRAYGGILALRLVGEQVPNPLSRLTLGDELDALGLPRTRLSWQMTEVDLETRRKAGEMAAREFGRLGLGRIQLIDEPGETFADWYIQPGYHHIGTTRMAGDPARGVVNRDGRLHSVGNVYVAGSSIFPAESNGTPTLTIVALALRLADHLKTRVFPAPATARPLAGATDAG